MGKQNQVVASYLQQSGRAVGFPLHNLKHLKAEYLACITSVASLYYQYRDREASPVISPSQYKVGV